jgi:hypothetical protein
MHSTPNEMLIDYANQLAFNYSGETSLNIPFGKCEGQNKGFNCNFYIYTQGGKQIVNIELSMNHLPKSLHVLWSGNFLEKCSLVYLNGYKKLDGALLYKSLDEEEAEKYLTSERIEVLNNCLSRHPLIQLRNTGLFVSLPMLMLNAEQFFATYHSMGELAVSLS